MSTIVTRAGKGSPLTHNEVDANFVNLNTDKVEKSGTDPVVINANSSSDAMRITQSGAGNALVVEDSTNPDSTPFVIDSSGAVVTGHTAAIDTYRIQTATATGVSLSNFRFSADTGGPIVKLAKSRSGTIGTNSVVSSGDSLGTLRWFGADNTNYVEATRIEGEVEGTPGTNNMPGRLVFSTTSAGSSTPTERLRIDSEGRIDMRSSTGEEFTGTGSISGTTLTITAVTSGSLAVGHRIYSSTLGQVEFNTIITALGTGTGGAGTYTINNTQTVASTTIRSVASGINTLRFTDTDTSVNTNQPIGAIEWFGSDSSTPGSGVKAYIASISESATPDTSLVFGTADNVTNAQAVARMRINSSGNVGIGTSSPAARLHVNSSVGEISRFVGNNANNYLSISDNNGTSSATFGAISGGNSYSFSAGYHSVWVGSSERARFNSDGQQSSVIPGGDTTLYPEFKCRAWVNFNGQTNSNLSATYSQTGTTVTVTATAHGLITGNSVYLDFTTGTAVDGTYDVTVTSADTFTVTQASRTTSGNVTVIQSTIRASGNVSSIADRAAGKWTVNFYSSMADSNYTTVFGCAFDDGASSLANVQVETASSVPVKYDANGVAILGQLSSGTNTDFPVISVAIFR